MEQARNQKVYDIRKRAYIFGLNAVRFIKMMPHDLSSEILSRQLLRAATSIGANIMEGQAASSRKDFINFHNHSLKSANETRFWISLIKDSGIGPREESTILLDEVQELAKILAAIILSAKNKRC